MEQGNSVNCLASSDILKTYFDLTVSKIQIIIRVKPVHHEQLKKAVPGHIHSAGSRSAGGSNRVFNSDAIYKKLSAVYNQTRSAIR